MREVLICEKCDGDDPCIFIPCKVNEEELDNFKKCPIEGDAEWKVMGTDV